MKTSTHFISVVILIAVGVGYVMIERHKAVNLEITRGLVNSSFSTYQSQVLADTEEWQIHARGEVVDSNRYAKNLKNLSANINQAKNVLYAEINHTRRTNPFRKLKGCDGEEFYLTDLETQRNKFLNEVIEIGIQKFEVNEVMSTEETLALATIACSATGVASVIGHSVVPFFGGIAANWLTNALVDTDYRMKYAQEKHPAICFGASLIASMLATPSLETPTAGRERSHFLPKTWGFESYTNPLNVSSVPVWYHNLTDRNLPHWAKNTVGLLFRAPPPLQSAGITLLRNFHSEQAVAQCKSQA